MKLTFSLIAVAALTLSACDVVEIAAVDTGREAAKAVIGPIVAEKVPGPAGVAITNCVIDHASGEELLRIGVQGATPENIVLVGNILSRPDTVTCATSALT